MTKGSFGHWSRSAQDHAPWEDAFGIATGVVLVTMAVAIYAELGLVTGGVAGIALLAHYAFDVEIGRAFFVLNLPFYALALLRMGWAFTLKTVACVALFSVLIEAVPSLLVFERLNPYAGAIAAGFMLGVGFLILFRHRASLGDIGILALFLQDRFGWRAGWVQLSVDFAILAAALVMTSPPIVALSVASSVLMNVVVAVNHREDRYVAR